MSARVGQLDELGDYDILEQAGAGGMGLVYRASQRSLGRIVALKVIRDDIARAPEYRERFLREARLAASVDHPNVVSVYDVGDKDDKLFLAMQWIDGEDLKHLIERTGRISPERAVLIAGQLAGALDAVHSIAGLIHRDVKPANVLLRLVGGRDHAYLTDFGVAKPAEASEHLTQTGWVVGTTGYLSPEQIMGREPTPRSDLYSLGCVFFEAITGQPPFRGENEMALRWAHANDPRPRASDVLPKLGTRYDAFVAAALAVDPEQRFASGQAFATALEGSHRGQDDITTKLSSTPTHTPTAIGPPTPLPPPANTPPPAYPGYQYATPPPGYPPQQRSGNPLALILLGLVALAGIAVGALAAAGVFSHNASGTQTITSSAHTTASAPTSASKRSAPPRAALGGAPAGGGSTSCGGGLTAGPHTSCAFAANVQQAYAQSAGGDTTVVAASPVTGQTYSMQCTGGTPHVCTGGNNASVTFTSASSGGSTGTGSSNSPPGNLTACDPNISAGPGTSCPFAENVFRAYAADYKANGQQSSNTVTATSPTTGQAYTMNCTTDGTTVNCSGGNNAFVTYPLHAVQVY